MNKLDINNSDKLGSVEKISTAVELSVRSRLFKIAYKYSTMSQKKFEYTISALAVNGVVILSVNKAETYKSLPIAIYNEDRNTMEWIYGNINRLYKEDIDDEFIYTFNNEYLSPLCMENNIPYIVCHQRKK